MKFESPEELRAYLGRKYSMVKFKSGNYGVQRNITDFKGAVNTILCPERFESLQLAKQHKDKLIFVDLDNLVDEVME
jgi:hypothetical protein